MSETSAEKWYRRLGVAFEGVFWVGMIVAAILGSREATSDLLVYAALFGVSAIVTSFVRRRQARKYQAWAEGKGRL